MTPLGNAMNPPTKEGIQCLAREVNLTSNVIGQCILVLSVRRVLGPLRSSAYLSLRKLVDMKDLISTLDQTFLLWQYCR